MLDKTIGRIKARYGKASTDTKKVLRWKVAPWLDVVVQRDVEPGVAYVWLPWSEGRTGHPEFGEVYEAGRGRHSNVGKYAATLADGLPALLLRVVNDAQLQETMRLMEEMRVG